MLSGSDKGDNDPLKHQSERRLVWALRWHYICDCGWIAKKSDFETEPATCPKCGQPPKAK